MITIVPHALPSNTTPHQYAGHTPRFQGKKPIDPNLQDCSKAFHNMLGDDLTKNTFQQGINNGVCYILSFLDPILHHPAGKEILAPLQLHRKQNPITWEVSYRFTFPSGEQVWINLDEIGQAKIDAPTQDNVGQILAIREPVRGPIPIQMLELACARNEQEERNSWLPQAECREDPEHAFMVAKGGKAEQTLERLFGGTKIILASGDEDKELHPLSSNPATVKRARKFLEQAQTDTEHYYLLTASTPLCFESNWNPLETRMHSCLLSDGSSLSLYKSHALSIRRFDMEQDQFIVADPHDTAREIHTLTFEQMCQMFQRISGIKIPKKHAERRFFGWF